MTEEGVLIFVILAVVILIAVRSWHEAGRPASRRFGRHRDDTAPLHHTTTDYQHTHLHAAAHNDAPADSGGAYDSGYSSSYGAGSAGDFSFGGGGDFGGGGSSGDFGGGGSDSGGGSSSSSSD